jgi:hypothetical protein
MQHIIAAYIQFYNVLDRLDLAVDIAADANVKGEYHHDDHAYLFHSSFVVLEVVEDRCGEITVCYANGAQENFNES